MLVRLTSASVSALLYPKIEYPEVVAIFFLMRNSVAISYLLGVIGFNIYATKYNYEINCKNAFIDACV